MSEHSLNTSLKWKFAVFVCIWEKNNNFYTSKYMYYTISSQKCLWRNEVILEDRKSYMYLKYLSVLHYYNWNIFLYIYWKVLVFKVNYFVSYKSNINIIKCKI